MDADVDVAVVGGGVIGCAVASVLSRAGRRVVLLEAGRRLGDGVTSRNSGVIHSGLYYSRGSLKAESCVRGNALLYEWAQKRAVPHAKIGKLVVAREAEAVAALEALAANARGNAAPGVELVSAAFVQAREPTVPAAAALWCPESGIVIEGRFSLGWIGRLTGEQLEFAGLLVRHRGNVQKVAAEMGVAYNTARNRLDDIVAALGGPAEGEQRPDRMETLNRLAAGEIDFTEAMRLLKG